MISTYKQTRKLFLSYSLVILLTESAIGFYLHKLYLQNLN